MIETFLLLLAGHALADFALQSDAMARGKNWTTPSTPPPGVKAQVCWPYWLSAHAAIHGGVVGLVTGRWELGVLEFVLHWLIDLAKCSRITDVHQDQLLHIMCKVAWIGVVWSAL